MIVRNEAAVIARRLASRRPIIGDLGDRAPNG
jgi:hypothetical protein